MYAEIRITVAGGLSSSLNTHAREWFVPTVPAPVAAAVLDRGEEHLQVAEAVLATLPPSHVMLVLRSDAASLRTYVQFHVGKPGLAALKDLAEETVDDVSRFLRAHGMQIASVRIWIFAEGERLATGRPVTWLDRFLTSARKEIAGRLSVPLATFLVSLALDSDIPRAAVSAAAAFVGVIVWLLLSTTLEKPGYRYE